MKLKIESVYIILTTLFYIGICLTFFLFLTNDESILWIFAEAFCVLGMLGIVIPDTVINLELCDVSIAAERGMMVLKLAIFCLVFSLLNKFCFFVEISTAILAVVDLFLERYIVKKISSANISVSYYIEELQKFDTSLVDGIIKYFVVYGIGIILFLNIQANIYVSIVCMMVLTILQYFVSNQIVSSMNYDSKNKLKFCLWIIFALTLVVASLNFEMVTCLMIGIYVMISIDSLQPKKTSLIKCKKENKK